MKKIVALLFLIIFICHKAEAQSFWENLFGETKTTFYTADIQMKYEAGEECAYYNGKRYTGKVYSLDESCYMSFKNGVAIEAREFYTNGALFFSAEFPFDKRIIWIYNTEEKGIIKAVYENDEWNYYNMLKPNKDKGTIPWISPNDCVDLLAKYFITISMVESCFSKLPNIGYCIRMPQKSNYRRDW